MSAKGAIILSLTVALLFGVINAPADEKKTEYIIGHIEWMPYSGRSPDGKQEGISIRIFEEAIRDLPIHITWRYLSGAEAFLLIRQGKIDGVLDAFMNRHRYHTYSFSNSYALAEYVGVSLREKGLADSLTYEQIKNLRICIPTAYFISDEINNNPNNTFVSVEREKDCIPKLSADEADIWLIDRRVGQYYLREARANSYKLSNVPVDPLPLYLITRKSDNFDLINGFNRGLAKLIATKRYERLLHLHTP